MEEDVWDENFCFLVGWVGEGWVGEGWVGEEDIVEEDIST